MEDELKDKNFKRDFWEWFDSLPKGERQKFQYYHADMSEIFFYNKIFRHKKQEDCPIGGIGRRASLRN